MNIQSFGLKLHVHNVTDIEVQEVDGANGTTWRLVHFKNGDDVVLEVACFPAERGTKGPWLTVKGEPTFRTPEGRSDALNETLRDIALRRGIFLPLRRQAD